jgi:hypothetical protein
MKKIALLILILFTQFQYSQAQVYPFYDDFESYTPFNVPTGYTGDITVYLTHGVSGSNGLAGYLTSFTNSDSIYFPWFGPLVPQSYLAFDWRMMDPFLYPSTSATLAPGDSFNIYISTDSVTWSQIFTINASNFSGSTSFVNETIPLDTLTGQNILIKVQGKRASGSAEFFIDIDNIVVDMFEKIDEANALNSFSFFPSPADQFVNFSNSIPLTGTIEIVDISGRIALIKRISNENSGMLDISSLSSGNYLLKVKATQGTKILPLIVR